jgi:hypothetical protein
MGSNEEIPKDGGKVAITSLPWTGMNFSVDFSDIAVPTDALFGRNRNILDRARQYWRPNVKGPW